MKKYLKYLKFLIIFLLPVALILIKAHLDNDAYDVIAEGREIVENGIYYTDKLSMHEGLEITVQNYLFAILFYYIYTLAGAAGIYITLIILNFLVMYLIYRICYLISEKNVNLSLLITLATDLLLIFYGFIVTRAQVLSFVLFLGLIFILELYVREKKKKLLVLIPVISLLQINLHASLWLMIFLVLLTYIIDSLKIRKLPFQGYPVKPIIIAGVVSAAVGLINPYGVKMMGLMFSSYGEPVFMNLIYELRAFGPLRSLENIMLYGAIMGSLVLYIFGETKRIRVRYLLLYFGFLVLGSNSTKGMSQFILVSLFPLAEVYKEKFREIRFGKERLRTIATAGVVWGGGVLILISGGIILNLKKMIKDYPNESLARAVNLIDEEVKEEERKRIKVYTGYDDGGYLEYRGYKPYLDPRGEVFLKENNGKEDILEEWVKFNDRKIGEEEMIKKYNFNFVIAREEDAFYRLEDERYKVIFDDDAAKLKVFQRVLDET